MKVFKNVFDEIGGSDILKKELNKDGGAVMITGCMESSKLHAVYGLSDGFKSSYPAKSPEVIIGDTKILADSPLPLKSAGF